MFVNRVCVAASFLSLGACLASADILVGPFVPNTGDWLTIPNGGFETGDMSGFSGGGPGQFTASSTMALFGTFSAVAQPFGNFNGAGFATGRGISLTIGEEYVISAFIFTGGVIAADLSIDLSDIVNDPQVYATPGVSEWQMTYKTFTATQSNVTLRLVCDGNVNINDRAYIDEVAITPVKDFVLPQVLPAPGALSIFGLTCLARSRRRS